MSIPIRSIRTHVPTYARVIRGLPSRLFYGTMFHHLPIPSRESAACVTAVLALLIRRKYFWLRLLMNALILHCYRSVVATSNNRYPWIRGPSIKAETWISWVNSDDARAGTSKTACGRSYLLYDRNITVQFFIVCTLIIYSSVNRLAHAYSSYIDNFLVGLKPTSYFCHPATANGMPPVYFSL